MFPTTFSFPSCVAINELVRLEMLGFFVVVAVIVFSLQRSSPTVSAVRSYTSHVRLSGIRKGKKNKNVFLFVFFHGASSRTMSADSCYSPFLTSQSSFDFFSAFFSCRHSNCLLLLFYFFPQFGDSPGRSPKVCVSSGGNTA